MAYYISNKKMQKKIGISGQIIFNYTKDASRLLLNQSLRQPKSCQTRSYKIIAF